MYGLSEALRWSAEYYVPTDSSDMWQNDPLSFVEAVEKVLNSLVSPERAIH
jgi:hypothetical protein